MLFSISSFVAMAFSSFLNDARNDFCFFNSLLLCRFNFVTNVHNAHSIHLKKIIDWILRWTYVRASIRITLKMNSSSYSLFPNIVKSFCRLDYEATFRKAILNRMSRHEITEFGFNRIKIILQNNAMLDVCIHLISSSNLSPTGQLVFNLKILLGFQISFWKNC